MPENPLQTIGEKLRAARETQGRSLDEIAAATSINRKSLKEIEQGIAPNLPAAYVRAFIKSYAAQVGIDASGLLENYDTTTTSPVDQPHETHSVGPDESSQTIGVTARPLVREKNPRSQQTKILVFLSTVLVGGLILSITWVGREQSSKSVQEISFEDVMKERDRKDSMKQAATASVLQPDSLRLVGVTSDTVWLRLSVDDSSAREYMLKPMSRIGWKALKHFVVSIGNPAGLSLALEGMNLGDMSKIRKPLLNVEITRDTLGKLAGGSPKKVDHGSR